MPRRAQACTKIADVAGPHHRAGWSRNSTLPGIVHLTIVVGSSQHSAAALTPGSRGGQRWVGRGRCSCGGTNLPLI
eukprot:scaffold31432_cov69-Phaeocystis_antarctica.AAC.7